MSSGRNIREATEKMRGDHNAASDSGLQLGESSRSTSLQDGQVNLLDTCLYYASCQPLATIELLSERALMSRNLS